MDVAPVKFRPVMVILLDVDGNPNRGEIARITGPYAYLSSATTGLLPPGPVTTMSTWPGSVSSCAGMERMTIVLSVTMMPAAGKLMVVPPMAIDVADLNPRPEIVTLFPPSLGPLLGAVATTCTPPVPAGAAGALTLSVVPFLLMTNPLVIDGKFPKVTLVTPRKLWPMSVTMFPPPAGPTGGVMSLTTGP